MSPRKWPMWRKRQRNYVHVPDRFKRRDVPIESDDIVWPGDAPACFAVDMTNLDGRTSHLLCHKPEGHEDDHGNDRYAWPQRRETT